MEGLEQLRGFFFNLKEFALDPRTTAIRNGQNKPSYKASDIFPFSVEMTKDMAYPFYTHNGVAFHSRMARHLQKEQGLPWDKAHGYDSPGKNPVCVYFGLKHPNLLTHENRAVMW